MDSAFGLVGKDYVIVVTDCSVVYSILKLKVNLCLRGGEIHMHIAATVYEEKQYLKCLKQTNRILKIKLHNWMTND